VAGKAGDTSATWPRQPKQGACGYYRRFDFELAEPIGVHPPQPEWTKHFQIRRLNAWTGAMGGMFRYATAFDRL
jgi:putative acetyltransferase